MQKLFLLLLAVCLASSVSAQSNTPQISWSDDHKVVVNTLPDAGQTIVLKVTDQIKMASDEIQVACEQMSNHTATWTYTEKTKELQVTPNLALYPKWGAKEWEVYMNRVVAVLISKQ